MGNTQNNAENTAPRTRRLFLGGAAVGVTTAALTGIGAATATTATAAEGDAPEVNGLGWHDVRGYGATGDGTTDDTLAIQAALDACEPGNTVYLPAGQYRTSAPVKIPPYVTLQGTHGGGENEWGAADPAFGLKPLPGFTGEAVVLVLDQLRGGYATKSVEVRILQLTIDGSALPVGGAEVDGIRAVGQVQHLQLRDVQVRKVTGHGINTTYNEAVPTGPQAPFCLHFDRVSVLWPGTYGIALNNSTDSVLHDVYVLGGNGSGWWIAGAGNSTFSSCRAEWSAKEGFVLRTWQGVVQFSGCSTDRNGYDGINVQNTDSKGILQLSGCRLTRDGRNGGTGGGGYAGLKVRNTTAKVFADGLLVTAGNDDDGSLGASPARGVSAGNSACTVVSSGFVDGVEIDWHDDGGNTVFQKGATVVLS
ncbi:right-handed parallel beta-helix repeat-containing protein [Streptomyces sp. GQFP]|uniref:right-handed parallel beta-helix repeat-containing protein n=1 Tax=Streptomyces sp. GQFP TaxID=2907545 RepID=UPI001F46DDF4|nr:right-handed parallel beta-helix repeat-containing protein [Streptomyces sp. GQFP]UIX33919.1 right-handed parallel beta-helix repeat-containing protein [Streptomyces sp. GQFP]